MNTIQERLDVIRTVGEKIANIWTDEEGMLFQRLLAEHIKTVEDIILKQRAVK